MADEDEIDVLGDFSLDNLLSKNESGIYDYDYSNHPQWILEHTNSSNWFHQNPTMFENTIETGIGDATNDIPDSGNPNSPKKDSAWTEHEKLRLEEALEIFGKSTVRISQFIGSKTPAQVKHYMKNYTHSTINTSFTNLYDTCEYRTENEEAHYPSLNMSEVIVESQIPASIEEVIASVSTAQPTVQILSMRKNKKSKQANTKSTVEFKQQIKTNTNTKKIKFSKKVTISTIPSGQSLLKNNIYNRSNKKQAIGSWNNVNRKKKSPSTKSVRKARRVSENELHSNKNANRPAKIQNNNPNSDLVLITGNGLSVPISSTEEVIRIQKSDQDIDSDIEIDVEDDGENEPQKILRGNSQTEEQMTEVLVEKGIIPAIESEEKTPTNSRKYLPFNSDLDSIVLEQFSNMNVPTEEFQIVNNMITEEEKAFNYEFFYGKGTKTPDRYLKIRRHILNSWHLSKPLYVSKSSIRSGLKNCGDVNSIGRVHLYLEQIGAINFSCDQTNYIRPLSKLLPFFSTNINPIEKKKIRLEKPAFVYRGEHSRQRHKKKLPADGEGGYTLTHNENGDIIETSIVTQETNSKSRLPRRLPIKLICCKNFTEDDQAPYKIQLHISALLSMDWHAHSSHSEVMGLLGGTFNYATKILKIQRYVPCKSATNSATHCDMCPVSQTTAYEIIQSENINVVGWFHSHPTFSPNPSQQDLETQLNMQQWYSNKETTSPFVGLILSPFSTFTNCLVSDYRCLIIKEREQDGVTQNIPYKFNINVISEGLNVTILLANAKDTFHNDALKTKDSKFEFFTPYFQDNTITYIDKMIASTKMHLAKCRDINKMTCDAIVQGITEYCIPS